MTQLNRHIIILVLAEAFSLVVPVYASQLMLGEGMTLLYRCVRTSSWETTYETWNTSIKVLAFNQTALVFQSNTTGIASTSAVVNINYHSGIPEYVDYLTALIYLPPESISQSLQGHLNWITQINSRTPAAVTNWTLQNLNFTVEAGSYQSINITLTLAGMDSGELTLIYDVSSGIMIYEQWVPIVGSQIYGDIIILSLTATMSQPETPQTIVTLILGIAVFATPALMFLQQVRRKLQRTHHARKPEPSSISAKESFPRKPFCVIVAGGLLSLSSILLPWSQLAGSQVYLPLSISSALAASAPFFASTSTFLAISLIVHASAIMVWVSIAMHIHSSSRFAPQVITLGSSALAFASIVIFLQARWAVSLGAPVLLLAGGSALFGTAILSMQKRSKTASQTA